MARPSGRLPVHCGGGPRAGAAPPAL